MCLPMEIWMVAFCLKRENKQRARERIKIKAPSALLLEWIQLDPGGSLEGKKTRNSFSVQFSSVLFSPQLCPTVCDPWTAACQASLSITNSWSLLKLTSIEWVIWSNHLILCCLLLPPSIFPSIRVFSMSQFFESRGLSIGVSASASVLPMNIQVWFPLGWTGWISLLSKGLSRVFSNTTVQKRQFSGIQLSYMTTGKAIALSR